jgi:hypothetical protein
MGAEADVIPSDLPVEPETDPWACVQDAGSSHPGTMPLKVAGVVVREVGKEAAKAARKFLRRINLQNLLR